MPDDRLERTRKAYRCGRSMVLVPWQHCDCKACAFARLMLWRMRARLAPDGRPYTELLSQGDYWPSVESGK